MRGVALLVLVSVNCFTTPPAVNVLVNFSARRLRYNTSTTVQVVTSPLLDRTLPTGKPNPIYEAAWGSLAGYVWPHREHL